MGGEVVGCANELWNAKRSEKRRFERCRSNFDNNSARNDPKLPKLDFQLLLNAIQVLAVVEGDPNSGKPLKREAHNLMAGVLKSWSSNNCRETEKLLKAQKCEYWSAE